MKKHLLFITQNLTLGGVQNVVSSLANHFIREYRCSILLFEEAKDILYPLDSRIELHTVALFKTNITQPEAGKKIVMYRHQMLQNALDKIDADIILPHEDYYNILTLECKTDAKIIATSHISLKNFYTQESKIHLLKPEYFLDNIQKLYGNALHIICVSKKIAHEINQLNPHAKTKVIYNGINHHEELLPKPLTYPYILNIGRANPQKGQKDLLKAFAKVATNIPYPLVIIGGGVLLSELKQLAKDLDIEKNVHFLGDIQNPIPYMQHAKFCINTSYQEGFSIAVLEMMYYSSLLSSKYEGYDEILKDYGNLFEVGDIDAIAKKLLYFANSLDASNQLRQQHTLDSKPFSLIKTLQNYQLLLEDLK